MYQSVPQRAAPDNTTNRTPDHASQDIDADEITPQNGCSVLLTSPLNPGDGPTPVSYSSSQTALSSNPSIEKGTVTSDQDASSENSENTGRGIEFAMDWALKAVGFAVAVGFGIFAPLSYQATRDANHSSDSSQSQLIDRISALEDQAEKQVSKADEHATKAQEIQSSALSMQLSMQSVAVAAQASQITAIISIGSEIRAAAQLSLLNYCAGATSFKPCQAFLSTIDTSSLVGYFANQPGPTFAQESTQAASASSSLTRVTTSTTTTTDSTATPTKTAAISHSNSPSTASLAPAAIMGIVMALLACIGAFLGWIVWMRRERRARKTASRRDEKRSR